MPFKSQVNPLHITNIKELEVIHSANLRHCECICFQHLVVILYCQFWERRNVTDYDQEFFNYCIFQLIIILIGDFSFIGLLFPSHSKRVLQRVFLVKVKWEPVFVWKCLFCICFHVVLLLGYGLLADSCFSQHFEDVCFLMKNYLSYCCFFLYR